MYIHIQVYIHIYLCIDRYTFVYVGLRSGNRQKKLGMFTCEDKIWLELTKSCWNCGEMKINGSHILQNERERPWSFTCHRIFITFTSLPQCGGYFCSCHAPVCQGMCYATSPLPPFGMPCYEPSSGSWNMSRKHIPVSGMPKFIWDSRHPDGFVATLIYLNLMFWRKQGALVPVRLHSEMLKNAKQVNLSKEKVLGWKHTKKDWE